MKAKHLLLTALLLPCLSVVSAKPHVVSAIEIPQSVMPGIIANYYTDIESIERVYIFRQHPEYFTRMRQHNDQVLAELKKLDFGSMSVSDQADYILFARNINSMNVNLGEKMQQYRLLEPSIPFAVTIVSLQQQRRRGKYLDAATTAAQLKTVQQQINTTIATWKKQLPSPSLQANAVMVVKELDAGLANFYNFYKGYDPQFTWRVTQPYKDADKALDELAELLKTKQEDKSSATDDGTGIKGQPIGAAALKQLLEYEMIPYTAEELVKIANREFEWCDAEMRKASQQMGFGTEWKKALEKTKTNYVEPGKQPELINRLAEEAIAFLEKNDLVTVPALAKEAWRMNMLTVEQQRFAPFFLGGESILIAYPTDEMNEATKEMSLRSNNYGFAHATVFHELIPGHNLQFFMNSRFKSYRECFYTPFSSEGWALYWEMLLWDKGFHFTPEEKVGALFWRMHRCARIIFSLNYHLGKWTPKQCIDFLVDRVGHEPFSAESEVRRSFTGGYGPLYQIAYMMGGLQLRALHKEITATGKMTEKQFHDTFLHENTLPIEMFRAIVLNQRLTRDYKTSWRFAGALK
ncbi:DUF885 family protein [uncultured Chitinophaga sp.]|uniref:DUF885 family protein n=1 Tax=uncultured Chitinophaga sp. TaxID=339340 RepID=UPI0025E14A5A|nr:DUF885 family protein [uncultured Chitinophaga sp.]